MKISIIYKKDESHSRVSAVRPELQDWLQDASGPCHTSGLGVIIMLRTASCCTGRRFRATGQAGMSDSRFGQSPSPSRRFSRGPSPSPRRPGYRSGGRYLSETER